MVETSRTIISKAGDSKAGHAVFEHLFHAKQKLRDVIEGADSQFPA
ncbi:hypothetical protein [Ruegeria sp. THAF57]|nr:hypothetical protein [Ruegeria sp. THAF57]